MFVGVIRSSRVTHGLRRAVQSCQLTPLTVRLSSSSCNGPQPMSRFGTERTALAREVALLIDALPQPPPYFLDNGTLLGLWREGALINSDDDFDFGVLVHTNEELVELYGHLKRQLSETLGNRYQCRSIDTFAHKIEVYDPSHGSFLLDGERYLGADYHRVSVDIQAHTHSDDDRSAVTIQHSDFHKRSAVNHSAYLPLGTVDYAGFTWQIPAEPKMLLDYLYGYTSTGAELDSTSMLYRKKFLKDRPLRVYTDMCADLFHSGHVNYLKQCQQVAPEVHLIVGLHSDATIASYKRASVCTMQERIDVVEACRYVDEVLGDAQLQVSEEYMDTHRIDLEVHGSETPDDERQAMYGVPIRSGRYSEVPRTPGISTTELIDRIASRLAVSFDDHAMPSLRSSPICSETGGESQNVVSSSSSTSKIGDFESVECEYSGRNIREHS